MISSILTHVLLFLFMFGLSRIYTKQLSPPAADRQFLGSTSVTYQISYYPADITLKGYLEKWVNSKQLYIPPYQRNYVWDQVQASKLIESFLLGLPVPGVFLYKERETNRLQVIDGQQRILSTIRYFQNDFDDKAFRLKNVLPKWNGKRYEDLDESDRYQLDDSVLRATIIQQLDPLDDSSVYHIFERLNTGGMKLNAMEIRKCVYLSSFYKFLEKLNNLPDYRLLIGRKILDKRLRDIEFILRVLAFKDLYKTYAKPMKTFLNKFMANKKRLTDESFKQYSKLIHKEFTSSCKFLLEAVGEKPFHLRGRLNYAVMDSIFTTSFLANHLDPKIFNKRYRALIKDKEYIEFVTQNTSDEKAVKARFELSHKYLLG